VRTLVCTELRGSLTIQPRAERGTRVRVLVPLGRQ
jgi:chemotaxis protein histidine kinase CheA